jgi:uncharacterized short protein YbdD (DUF466 family)
MRTVLRQIWRSLAAAGYAIAEAFGEHDYDRYLADWRIRHPNPTDHSPMTAREFFDRRIARKYPDGWSRC